MLRSRATASGDIEDGGTRNNQPWPQFQNGIRERSIDFVFDGELLLYKYWLYHNSKEFHITDYILN